MGLDARRGLDGRGDAAVDRRTPCAPRQHGAHYPVGAPLPQEQQRARAALALVAADVGLGNEARLAGGIVLMDNPSGFGHSKRKA